MNLQKLVDDTTGAHNLLGIIVKHPQKGKFVLVDVDRRNNSCTIWNESNGFYSVLNTKEYDVINEPTLEKKFEAMKIFLS